MSLLVVGSVAIDSVKTPFGYRERSLGGAATHFAASASYFTDVSVVGVVGEDFTADDMAVFHERKINTENLQQIPGGKTFRWVGEYGFDLKTAAMLAAAFSIPGGLLRAVGGYFSDKFGAHTMTWWVLWIALVCLFFLSYPQTNFTIITVTGPATFHIGQTGG